MKPKNLMLQKFILTASKVLGKNLIPTATDFECIDKFVKVTDEESAHTARELASNRRSCS